MKKQNLGSAFFMLLIELQRDKEKKFLQHRLIAQSHKAPFFCFEPDSLGFDSFIFQESNLNFS
ncbi:hypothetical protein B0A67_23150 [Flavobacterium aquidurense]|jgi:hypothetical protein|uniref:hypothetical protein n=1 Tax=Flavobacterium aquidurense TaxID=362413 RepID=UPI0009107A5F|nr:hypothetical protein [Flavobacterium aquidurense]OXA66492.1 hypothetical protein B0A67_23150 [Flavobacterium aquidurense]SHH75204.1 hypothetical protein SAMN05444481_12635 [Flavobacterium frigidimaris]